MIVIVTGTPGTGKTTFAKTLAKEKKYTYIDGKKLISQYHLREEFDEQNNCDVVDEQKFAKICKDIISEAKDNKESLIIDSHLAQFIPSVRVDKCYVTVCDLKILEQRLKARAYSSKKIKDNLEAEAFRICQIEAQEQGHLVEIIDTSSF